MNTILTKAIKEDSLFCNHFLNIQIDFLIKLFKETENPIVGEYIVDLLDKAKKYRFWKIIRPILINRNLNFWNIKFNFISKLYKDERRKIIYLPSYYPRDDIVYTFRDYRDERDYIKIHLEKIETFFISSFNKFFKDYTTSRDKRYQKKKNDILKHIGDEHSIFLVFPVVKKPKISKIATKNISKKIVQHYIDEVSF